ncbi:hypothetical protein RS130_03290 [Paraglaciecola aquimarina]|uniref:Uncharacterized protein n=1 Tax=Paraglaciecola aquimarina TaxID=1235557 RepID=A0ABU3SSY7_9ALTE|nr:hypothetical protein [Paraglaciecola aquimarina]MDU0353082.1 hypothetical protein [Paraglaciecola aquimarina]
MKRQFQKVGLAILAASFTVGALHASAATNDTQHTSLLGGLLGLQSTATSSSSADAASSNTLNLSDLTSIVDVNQLTDALGLPELPVVSSLVSMNNEILIQGGELPILRDLVNLIGGVITHELPIVSGIGIRVSDLQLAILKQLPLIVKVTENQAVFTAGSLEQCQVYGSHVLDASFNKVKWNLYNGRDIEANVSEMELTLARRFRSRFIG